MLLPPLAVPVRVALQQPCPRVPARRPAQVQVPHVGELYRLRHRTASPVVPRPVALLDAIRQTDASVASDFLGKPAGFPDGFVRPGTTLRVALPGQVRGHYKSNT